MNPTHTAIVELYRSLETLETNEPINRREGNDDQAELEARSAAEIRQALAILEVVFGRASQPIWPEPALS